MSEYFPHMLTLARDAGEIALRLIDRSHASLKPDASVITEADKTISALTHERLAPFLASGKHLLVEEEDPRKGEYLREDFLKDRPYLWSVDPIDATRAYANRMPHYGISIGLLKDLKPWLGVVYFPSLRELFYCDGEEAVFIQDVFSSHEVRTKIVPVDEQITSRSVFIASDEILGRFDWKSSDCRVMILAAAVCEFCWPAIGRGCGSLSKVHLWDMAGSWPIFERAGLKMFSLETGQALERISPELFHSQGTPWKFKDDYILSSPRNFPVLHSKLIKK